MKKLIVVFSVFFFCIMLLSACETSLTGPNPPAQETIEATETNNACCRKYPNYPGDCETNSSGCCKGHTGPCLRAGDELVPLDGLLK